MSKVLNRIKIFSAYLSEGVRCRREATNVLGRHSGRECDRDARVYYTWKGLTGHCYSGRSSLGNNRASGTQPIRKRDMKGKQNRTKGKPDRKRWTVTSYAASHPPTHKHTLKTKYPRWCWTQSHNIHSLKKISNILMQKKHPSIIFMYNKYFGLLAEISYLSFFLYIFITFFLLHSRKLRPWISVLKCIELKYLACLAPIA